MLSLDNLKSLYIFASAFGIVLVPSRPLQDKGSRADLSEYISTLYTIHIRL